MNLYAHINLYTKTLKDAVNILTKIYNYALFQKKYMHIIYLYNGQLLLQYAI